MPARRAQLSIVLAAVLLVLAATAVYAAVACSLSNPDRDVKNLYNDSTGYRTDIWNIKQITGLEGKIEAELGRQLNQQNELDVDYASYRVLKGDQRIGLIMCSSERGKYGVIQVITALDNHGTIRSMHLQKHSHPKAAAFRDAAWLNRFVGLTRADLKSGKAYQIPSPAGEDGKQDTLAIIQGLHKQLIMKDAKYGA